ncbi:MAG TPA: signal peptidase I [Micromonosporaceae bacterium]|nr:signal peptidase I [Micromonosporaceae bacterium]
MTPADARDRTGAGRSVVAAIRLGQFVVARTALGIASTLLLISVAPVLAGWSSEVVVSGSMLPRIAPGDVVVSQPVTAAEVAVGQIVLIANPARPGTLLMHRVIGRDPDGSLRTRGDANDVDDSTPVPASMVRGLPRIRIPYLGLPALWQRHGRYDLVATVCLVLMGATVAGRGLTGPGRPTESGTAAGMPAAATG